MIALAAFSTYQEQMQPFNKHWNQENWAELKVERLLQGGGGTVEQGHIFQVINGCRSFFNPFTLLSELMSDNWRMYLSCFIFVRRKNFYCFVVQISFGIMQLFFVEFTPRIPSLLLFICRVDRQSTKGATFALKQRQEYCHWIFVP